MAPQRQRKNAAGSLKAGRPSFISKPNSQSHLSASKSRQLIRSHHTLSKVHAQAVKAGDQKLAAEIASQLEAQGGLARYQDASKAGQSMQRGGDSSVVLVEWLKQSEISIDDLRASKLKMLEVGALSTENACSKAGFFDVERIDLNSQSAGIKKQDFMERPVPGKDYDRFDCVSLSLVLNFVPDPRGRGEMLKRVSQHLRAVPGVQHPHRQDMRGGEHFPSLFLVLPAPCVMNSRYLDQERLTAIMQSLGYTLMFSKTTEKLVYYLWLLVRVPESHSAFAKVEVNPGKTRNNFAIVLEQG